MSRAARTVVAIAATALVAACGPNGDQDAKANGPCRTAGLAAHDPASGADLMCSDGPGGRMWLTTGTSAAAPSTGTGQGDLEAATGGYDAANTPKLESLPIDVRAVDYRKVLTHYSTYDSVETKNFPLLPFGLEEKPGGQRDPQPGFYAPIGTDVLAPITGIVTDVIALEHGDWSIMFGPDGKSSDIWETEHVIQVAVQVGDHVTAGQPVAKISDYDCTYSRSLGNDAYCRTHLGIVELGYLVGDSQVPTHLCPFEPSRIDSAQRDAILADYTWALDQSERARGKPYMDRTTWATPHCEVTEPITG